MNADDVRSARLALDHIQIEEAARRFGRGLDGRAPGDDQNFDRCFTDDVEVIYESPGFFIGRWRGVEATKRNVRALAMTVYSWTQHMFMNSIIDVDGDTAHAEFYVFAAHGFEGKVIYAGAVYRQNFRRTSDGWRISRHECVSNWIDDAGGLLQASMAAMAKG